MHIYLCMYTCYVSITYLLYIWYINLQHFFHACSFCYFSYMLFIMNKLTIDMLGIYHRVHWCGMVEDFSVSLVRNFLHVVHILFFVVHMLLYIPQTFLNIIYFVGIAYDITYTFACEFSFNFLSIDAYYNSLLGCFSEEEFTHTFADVLMNEFETMISQFAQYMCIVCNVYLHRHLSLSTNVTTKYRSLLHGLSRNRCKGTCVASSMTGFYW